MAEQLKNIYNPDFIQSFLEQLTKVYPGINPDKFTKDIFTNNWKQKELKQRMRHISKTLSDHLPSSYAEAIKIILQLTANLKKDLKGEMSFEYMFLPDFIEQFGLDDLRESSDAMEEITQLASAEFAVRPFLIKYPNKMLEQMMKWSKNKNAMVRRLASEGSRPRLPWGMGIPALKTDPSPIIPILENLKNDESETVRRSVANNLNDISKDHPGIVIEIVKKWKGTNPLADKLVKHASRTLLKKAHPEIMEIFGVAPVQNISIDNFTLTKESLQIGEELSFQFTLTSTNPKSIFLRVEYAIDYLKSKGNYSRKKFKITENTYLTNKPIKFQRKQSFRDMTTRKHYPGIHKIHICINGIEMSAKDFNVTI